MFNFTFDRASDRRSREFRLFPWRECLGFRNDVIRSTALRAVDDHVSDLSRVIEELRCAVTYEGMGKRDQDLFRQYVHWLRTIVGDWSLLNPIQQAAFRAGHLPPSSAASLIKAARKVPSTKH